MVIGASGMLGQGVCSVLDNAPGFQVTKVTRANHDVLESWDDAPCTRGFGFVINCVGAIPQRQPPYTEEEFWELNCEFPKSLAEKCATRGANLVHVTTDCAFLGTKSPGEFYTEEDPRDAQDVYGRSKVGPEDFLVSRGALVIRTSIVGANKVRGTGLYEWFRAEVASGKRVPGYTNHWWNGVTTREFGRVLTKVFQESRWEPGLVHLFSPETVSKATLLRMFAGNLGMNPDLVVEETEHSSTINRALGTTLPFCSRMGVRSLLEQIRDVDG